MADRWMDERDRDWRDRDRRRTEAYGRGGEGRGRSGETRGGEDRSWSGPAEDDRGSYGRLERDRERYGERPQDARDRSDLTGGGDYERADARRPASAAGAEPGRYGAPRFSGPDYTGRSYADEAGRRGEDYGRGRFADERREGYGYVGGRDEARAWGGGEDRSYDRYGAEMRRRAAADDEPRRTGRREDWDERQDDRGRGEGPGDFLQRAGERIGSWFRGDRDEDRGETRRYSADFGREARWEIPGRGHRGAGPRGYRRSDERISEEVHERLTDDPWLDASNIEVEVKDGEVTLLGHVDNREAKHRAERLVEDLSGVRHVQNNLRVDAGGGLTGAGRGYGSSVLEAEMRRNSLDQDPGNNGASGLSGRTSAGAAAERSGGTATEGSVDPKTGLKR